MGGVWLTYDGNEVLIGSVEQIQSLAGPECETEMESREGKIVLHAISELLAGVVEELLYSSDPTAPVITVEIR